MKASRIDKAATVKEKIILFLTEPDVQLTAEEEKVLARWETADNLLQLKLELAAIIEQIADKHNVSRFTAQNDVFVAQDVFGSVRKLNKSYVLYLKYQRQDADIEKLRKKIFAPGFKPNAKLMQALSMLEKAATYTMNSIPSEIAQPSVKRPVMFFQVNNNAAPMTVSEAITEADDMIKIIQSHDGTN